MIPSLVNEEGYVKNKIIQIKNPPNIEVLEKSEG